MYNVNFFVNLFYFLFSSVSVQVDQPEWKELTTVIAAQEFATLVGYPVLIRPSFVLSGRICCFRYYLL